VLLESQFWVCMDLASDCNGLALDGFCFVQEGIRRLEIWCSAFSLLRR
jgi:hypothetical protein